MVKSTINSTIMGKAYEYACVLALSELLEDVRLFEIIENSSLRIARTRYEEISKIDRAEMLKSAKVGMVAIIDMEPRIIEDGKDKLSISLQSDDVAKSGDIRDVLIIRRSIEWEIGISVKHNHAALKHSRLSATIDFGKLWFGKSCSETYFNEIIPIFSELKLLKDTDKLWSEIRNKNNIVYVPILQAFMKEFNALYNKYGEDITSSLVKYLLGSNGKDYYKLIHYNNHITRIQPFNLLGTLNQSSIKQKPNKIFSKILLPTKILDLSFKEKSTTTVNLTMNNGWAISFRIHNASSHVETSLKFDIQLRGQPADLFYLDIKW
ncbi:MAG: HaeIII family restriction endonuclease [Lactobacillaceae bacterium]|jgi:hypothetical protein|nr:HaeIII family restriction endonuclease [Lactobacillaceae bacterium]